MICGFSYLVFKAYVLPIHVTCKSFGFYCCCCIFKIMSCLPIWCSFCLVFVSILVHASILTHPNRSAPVTFICVTFCRPSQNMMSGEISPVISPQIISCETLNVPCLPCFCVCRVPCAPLHQHVPILTHLHLFASVYTLNCNLYYVI